MSTPARVAVSGAVFLGLFAFLFSIGSALGAWPPPRAGAWRGSDLAAGFVFALVLLVTLLAPRATRHSLG